MQGLSEQECGSPNYSQTEEQVKRTGRSHRQQPVSSSLACEAVLTTKTYQDFAKSPSVLERQEKVGWQTRLAEADLPDLQCGPSWLFSLSYEGVLCHMRVCTI